jgi:hypothetical protein
LNFTDYIQIGVQRVAHEKGDIKVWRKSHLAIRVTCAFQSELEKAGCVCEIGSAFFHFPRGSI